MIVMQNIDADHNFAREYNMCAVYTQAYSSG